MTLWHDMTARNVTASIVLVAAVPCSAVGAQEPRDNGVRMNGEQFRAFQEAFQDGAISPFERQRLRNVGLDDATIDLAIDVHRPATARAPGVPHLLVPIRDPISREELDFFLLVLQPSSAQSRFITDEHARYLKHVRTSWLDKSADLWSRSAAAASENARSPKRAAMYRVLVDDATKLDSDLASDDAAFFNAIRTVLADGQLPSLERVELLRRRQTACPRSMSLPAAGVDLSVMYLSLAAQDPAMMAPLDSLAFETALIDYERRLTHLVEELGRTHWATEVLRCENLVAGANAIDVADAIAIHDKRKQIGRDLARSQSRVHALNLTVLNSMALMLSPDGSQRLVESVRLRSYPIVYPLDLQVIDLCGRLANLAIDNDSRIALETINGDLAAELESVGNRMAERYVAWCLEVCEQGGYDPSRYRVYQRDMIRLLGLQQAANLRSLDLISGTVPASRPMVDEARSRLEESFAKRSDAGDGAGYGWPGPTNSSWHMATSTRPSQLPTKAAAPAETLPTKSNP